MAYSDKGFRIQESDFVDGALGDHLGALSSVRFARYLRESERQTQGGARWYMWNVALSRDVAWILHVWELTLRNRVADFLADRYGASWCFDDKFRRNLIKNDLHALTQTEKRVRKSKRRAPTVDDVIGNLTVGFWVSLLSDQYKVPMRAHATFPGVFVDDPTVPRIEMHEIAERLRSLRNRVSHLEPIYHLPLARLRSDAIRMTAAMSRVSADWLVDRCQLPATLALHPRR